MLLELSVAGLEHHRQMLTLTLKLAAESLALMQLSLLASRKPVALKWVRDLFAHEIVKDTMPSERLP
jgi:hypothetical protein